MAGTQRGCLRELAGSVHTPGISVILPFDEQMDPESGNLLFPIYGQGVTGQRVD